VCVSSSPFIYVCCPHPDFKPSYLSLLHPHIHRLPSLCMRLSMSSKLPFCLVVGARCFFNEQNNLFLANSNNSLYVLYIICYPGVVSLSVLFCFSFLLCTYGDNFHDMVSSHLITPKPLKCKLCSQPLWFPVFWYVFLAYTRTHTHRQTHVPRIRTRTNTRACARTHCRWDGLLTLPSKQRV